MVKAPHKRKAATQAEVLLPKEPLWYAPDYRKVRRLIIAAERLSKLAGVTIKCKYSPNGMRDLPALVRILAELPPIITAATEEVKAQDRQEFLRFTDDWLPEAQEHRS